MPSADTSKPISWADQVEEGDLRSIPPPEELLEGDFKKLIEYKRDEDNNKLIQITRTFKIEKRKASKSVAHRKQWAKYGKSASDPPGPNPGTTAIVHDEVFMSFISSKDNENQPSTEDQLEKLKAKRIMVCRVCKGDHWTTKCPYKESLEPLQRELLGTGETAGATDGDTGSANPEESNPGPGGGSSVGKYIPPGARDGGKRRGETMAARRDEAATIRVTNLSEDTRESDLQDLFRPFGAIQRIYLAQDKITGHSKGFAFINFYLRESAAKAIQCLSGFGYDHLILKVEWAKPSGHTT
ncbi:eukaryotic translation initiation factor 3 subunit G isoform X2 [Strongylocentrotus purpuratus]|uniref:Eukaryotic translation initiation factor 3 subunit G n=1 Tax=Strongylocentrotus purpuratus TaxID=7668 RepID=A0A7M7RHT2_STRPU|nr:eukaryotic translation initiation factor 3 subunit G isoform X2 [Strongylocentrotus purpuratus]|eukprot:XP_791582.2 PREDICTED: eukaryotic translation initiation factor 3 subunit G [Strongylocentrotus purpuratus]